MSQRRLGQLATTGCRTSQFLTAGERLTAAPAERAAEGGESAERLVGRRKRRRGAKLVYGEEESLFHNHAQVSSSNICDLNHDGLLIIASYYTTVRLFILISDVNNILLEHMEEDAIYTSVWASRKSNKKYSGLFFRIWIFV